MRWKRLAIILVCLILFISAAGCDLPERNLPGVTIFMSQPSNGAVLALGPITVQAAADIASTSFFSTYELGTFSFYANAEKFAEVTSGGGTRSTVETVWEPSAPGEYFLQASVEIGSQEATSESIRVCVVETPPGEILDTGIWGYTGPCFPPPPGPLSESGRASMRADASPSNLYYNPEGVGDCRLVYIDFTAYVTDPVDDVRTVMVEYSIPAGTGTGLGEGRVFLDLTEDLDLPEKLFVGTTGDLGTFFDNFDVTGVSEIEWTAYAYAADWSFLERDGPYTIPVLPCGTAPLGTPISQMITITPELTKPRCELFENTEMEYVPLEWLAGSPLIFYIKMGGGVPGLETAIESDTEPWKYSTRFGDFSSEKCEFLAGYPERLYCTIELPSEYSNTKKPLELFINGCDLPIDADPQADVPGLREPTTGGSKDSGNSGGCQPPAGGCGANSSWFAEPYCMCSPY